MCPVGICFTSQTGWWFQTCFIFHNIWDNPSHWLILFKMVIAPPTSEDKYFLVIPNIFLWCEKLGDKTLGPVQWLDDDRENRGTFHDGPTGTALSGLQWLDCAHERSPVYQRSGYFKWPEDMLEIRGVTSPNDIYHSFFLVNSISWTIPKVLTRKIGGLLLNWLNSTFVDYWVSYHQPRRNHLF